jgi:hypothetical protein
MSGPNQAVTTTLSSERIEKPPTARQSDTFMDGQQQNKTTIDMKTGNRKDLNSSQIFILHQNVQILNNKLLQLTVLLQLDLKKCSELTDSMEVSSTQEVTRCATTQELPNMLWNPKVHNRIHKSLLLVTILSQTPTQAMPPLRDPS